MRCALGPRGQRATPHHARARGLRRRPANHDAGCGRRLGVGRPDAERLRCRNAGVMTAARVPSFRLEQETRTTLTAHKRDKRFEVEVSTSEVPDALYQMRKYG